MATISELCETVHKTTGASLPDIQHRSRRLREEGHLPQKGRGLSAAHVTAEDCARLIVGLLARASEISAASKVSDAVKKFGALKGDKLEIQDLPVPLILPLSFLKALEAIIEGLRHPDLSGMNYWATIAWVGLTTKSDETIGWIEVREGKTLRRHEYGFRKAYYSALETHIQESRIHYTVLLKIAELLSIVPRAAKDKKETARLGATSEPSSKAMPGVISTRALKSKHPDGTTQKRERQSPFPYDPPKEIGDEKLSPQYTT